MKSKDLLQILAGGSHGLRIVMSLGTLLFAFVHSPVSVLTYWDLSAASPRDLGSLSHFMIARYGALYIHDQTVV